MVIDGIEVVKPASNITWVLPSRNTNLVSVSATGSPDRPSPSPLPPRRRRRYCRRPVAPAGDSRRRNPSGYIYMCGRRMTQVAQRIRGQGEGHRVGVMVNVDPRRRADDGAVCACRGVSRGEQRVRPAVRAQAQAVRQVGVLLRHGDNTGGVRSFRVSRSAPPERQTSAPSRSPGRGVRQPASSG